MRACVRTFVRGALACACVRRQQLRRPTLDRFIVGRRRSTSTRRTTAYDGVRWRTASDGVGRRRTASDGVGRRRTASDGVGRRRTASDGVGRRRTASDGVGRRRTASDGVGRRRTASDGVGRRVPTDRLKPIQI